MKFVSLIFWGCLMQMGIAHAAATKFFPYAYTLDTLANGLQLVTVPTEHKNLVALYIVVKVGSRNEVEPGKTGFAHFFEHIMFRGSEHYSSAERDSILKKAGAESNAYTDDDRTVYHELFAREDLPEILKLEADRFEHLKYDLPEYKTEALAVLGEYNKNSANPINKLIETLRSSAFTTHTYKHTTMGFVQDIQNMPNQYDYSLEFYKRFYRPERTTIVVVGDVKHEVALDNIKKYFSDWRRSDYKAQIPTEPPQAGEKTAIVDWPSPTLPYLVVAFHGPAFSLEKKDKAALDFVVPLAFGENSALYQKLVLKEQKVDVLEASFGDQADPELFAIIARVKNEKDMDYVRNQIIATFQNYTKEKVSQKELDETRSRLRYSTALSWVSANAIAGFLAPYIALGGTPDAVNKLFDLYQNVTPEDILECSKKYFIADSRTIVTLTAKPTTTEERK